MSRGMPGYQSYAPEQVRKIHAYIRAGAREALGVRSPATGQVGAGGL